MIKKSIATLFFVSSLLLFASSTVSAIDLVADVDCSATPDAVVCKSTDTLEGNVLKIINTLIYIVGIVSVVSIIIGGFMYVTSSGITAGSSKSESVNRAKSTITYAVIGIIVAMLAYAIVNFVIIKFTPTP